MKSKDLRLLLTLSGSRRLFWGALAGSIISAVIVIVNALLLGAIIVGIIYRHPSNTTYIVELALLWIFRALFNSQFEYWCSMKASSFKREFRESATTTLNDYRDISSTELSALLIKGANSLDIYLGRFLPQLLGASIVPFAVIATIFFLDPLSALIAVLTSPLIPIFGALIGLYTNDAVSKKWKSLGTLSAYFEDSLKGFVTLKIFGRNRTQGERIKEMGDQYTDETMKVLRISFLSALALELAATISVAMIAVSIGLRLVDSRISFIHGLTVLILAPEVYFPLRNAATLFHASADGSEILSRIESLKTSAITPPVQEEKDFSRVQSISWSEWILEIPHVIHSRITPVSLSRGKTVFILGESGIGKTAFAQEALGLNFNSPLLLDGQPVQPQHVLAFQQNIGWIPQLPQLAPGSIREQFQLIAPGIPDLNITQALANVDLSLSDLPHGLDTYLGTADEKSAELSGGQQRKIAVARALLRKPILILADEPTADLDLKSAQSIMSALRGAVAGGAALICITHENEFIEGDDVVILVERVNS